jgi:hypothetical protein
MVLKRIFFTEFSEIVKGLLPEEKVFLEDFSCRAVKKIIKFCLGQRKTHFKGEVDLVLEIMKLARHLKMAVVLNAFTLHAIGNSDAEYDLAQILELHVLGHHFSKPDLCQRSAEWLKR